MEKSNIYGLPFIAASQSQKHITHNEALSQLDAFIQLSVKSRTTVSPPEDEDEGTRYLVPQDASGSFLGHEASVAAQIGGAWVFVEPVAGMRCWVEDESLLLFYTEGEWREFASVIDALTLDTAANGVLSKLGVGLAADDQMRLAVKTPDAVITHGASGDVALRLNRAVQENEASLAFLSNWQPRALLGHFGQDNFTLKVSADGSAYLPVWSVDGVTGEFNLLCEQVTLCSTEHGAQTGLAVKEELIDLTGAHVQSTLAFPARAIVFCVSLRVTQSITGVSSFHCGLSGELSKFGGFLSVAEGAHNVGVVGPFAVYADTPIVITAEGGNFSGGQLRIALHYLLPSAAQS
ncbi:DUF2793 domain-containing protein [Flexibacterium corallicola]|uniref:DUF2793 domain-containing protein n=1 Tax=Flexibacterium corallicola TaxID=3037259 RepID=UPI00286F17A8|nr:DUF2793 domain-containing protein [Pseudovibrio sp. M1P-2-3]